MSTTLFELNDLPPRLVEAITSATVGSDLVIVDKQAHVARIVLFPSGPTRIAGLHAGTIELADDFDAPFSDGFWVGSS